MKLLKLTLHNFKGIRNFTLDANGDNLDVFGDNATGKSTLFDALCWLLFDKDSQNKKDFEIKTLDVRGQLIHNIDHEVEGTFDIGETIVLRKVFAEKWTKKRGSATAEFAGHTTDYYVDGVPVKKGEFNAKITEIANEDIFKLLTNPSYFNEQLHWQERRKILLEVCGDISDEDVIASDKSLAKLPEILNGRKLEDHKKVIANRRSEINKELDKIPVRIDEAQRNLPDISNIVPDELAQKIAVLKDRIKEKEKQISQIENGGAIFEKTKALREVEGQLIELKNKHRSVFSDQISAKRNELQAVKSKAREVQVEIQSISRKIEANDQQAEKLNIQMDSLRNEWAKVDAENFTYEQDDICPTCGQPLPAEMVAEARYKALTQFNKSKANHLESISTKGKEYKAEVLELIRTNGDLKTRMEEIVNKSSDLISDCKVIEATIENMNNNMEGYNKEPAYVERLQKKEAIEAAIADLKSGKQGETTGIKIEIDSLESEIKTAENSLANVKLHVQGENRIQELQDQERKLAAEFEKLEKELYLAEQFVRSKVKMLEEKINSRFRYARFKLFETQINGGLNECCETLLDGVSYTGGLNNAARINIGLDIINTLSEHYNFAAPIFVDNAEAVTRMIKTFGQVIRLIVSEKDKKLRVEKETA